MFPFLVDKEQVNMAGLVELRFEGKKVFLLHEYIRSSRQLDHMKTSRQAAVVWSCFPFIRSGQNHLARHSTVKGEEDKADRGRGGKTTSGKWTDLEFSKSQRAVENREKWRKLVAKLSVVPQQPSQLRD